MISYIKTELKRAIFSKSAILAFCITIIILLLSLIDIIFFNYNIDLSTCKKYYDSADVFLRCIGYNSSSILCVVAPLLASLVFSNSYLQDKDSNYLKFIYSRLDKRKYIISRLLTNALSSGIVILLALLLVLIFITLLLGVRVNSNSLFNITGAFTFIYTKSKWIYILYFIGNLFIFNIVFSTIGLGLSPFINNKYLAFLCPFAIYMISMTLFPYIGLNFLNMGMLFLTNTAKSELFVIMYESVLLIIGIILFYLGVQYRNEKDL